MDVREWHRVACKGMLHIYAGYPHARLPIGVEVDDSHPWGSDAVDKDFLPLRRVGGDVGEATVEPDHLPRAQALCAALLCYRSMVQTHALTRVAQAQAQT